MSDSDWKGVVDWWFSIGEDARVAILSDADAGDIGAQEAIVDVAEALDPIGLESLDEWIAEVREGR